MDLNPNFRLDRSAPLTGLDNLKFAGFLPDIFNHLIDNVQIGKY